MRESTYTYIRDGRLYHDLPEPFVVSVDVTAYKFSGEDPICFMHIMSGVEDNCKTYGSRDLDVVIGYLSRTYKGRYDWEVIPKTPNGMDGRADVFVMLDPGERDMLEACLSNSDVDYKIRKY